MEKDFLKYLLLLPIILCSRVLFGQAFDAETEKIKGINKLVEYYYNGSNSENISKAEFEFDKEGNVIKAFYYNSRTLVSQNDYHYDEKGLLVQVIEFIFGNRSRTDTINYTYKFDSKNRIICKEKIQPKWIVTTIFQDFDTNGNAQTEINSTIYRTVISKIKFNSHSQPIYKQKILNNSIFEIEETEYNKFGDIECSYIPTLLDKLTGKEIKIEFLLKNRYSVVENYEYKYDELDRWTERYVIHKRRKVLLNKRIYI